MSPTKTEVLEKLQILPNSHQEAELIVKDVIPKLSSGELSLHEVVEGLESSLTHTSPTERGAGTRLLANLLHGLPRSQMNQAEISFLTSFLLDRLKDHHSVVPNIFYACLALVEQERITGEDVRKLVQGIFREVHTQSHIMFDRRNIYTFLKYCILNKLEELQPLGTDFTLGLVSAVDGERDPRNLILVFSLAPVVVQALPPGPFTEDLFEVIAAYFPIDFVPPANDPYGISQDDLVMGLRRALSSTPLFAPYCLPLLQEKLDSDLASAKLDALHTLVSCCELYSSEDIRPHVTPLWHSIRREVADGTGAGVEQAALSALTAVAAALGRGPVSPAALQASQSLVQLALSECVVHLSTPEQRLMFPSARLLLALVVAGQGPASTISAIVLPLLAEQFGSKGEEAAQRNTITILGKFLGAAAAFPDLLADTGSLGQNEEVWWLALSMALTQPSPQVQEAAVVALTTALPALGPHRLPAAATTLTTALLDSRGGENLRGGIVECLATLGRLHPSATLDHVLPQLMAEMERESSDNTYSMKEDQVLDTLAALTLACPQVSHVLPLLWGWAKAGLAKKVGEEEVERATRYLTCVRKILVNTLLEPECRDYVVNEWRGIRQTMTLAVGAILECQHTAKLPSLLGEWSAICRLLVTTLSDPQPLVESIISLAGGGGLVQSDEVLTEALATHPDAQNVLSSGFVGDSSKARAQYMVYVAEGILLGAKSLPESATGILGQLRGVGRGAGTGEKREREEKVREVAAILHAAVINKVPKGPSLTRALEETWNDLRTHLEPGAPVEERRSALTLATWTCKALVMRGAEGQQEWWTWLQKLLSDPVLGMEAAHSFGTIVKDHHYAMTPQTHANIRLLYKQRFFESVAGTLVETFNTTQDVNTKSCTLVAIASLLPWLPHIVLNAHIKKLLPVLLQGLNASSTGKMSEAGSDKEEVDAGRGSMAGCGSETRQSTLATLASLLKQNATPATPHTSTLVAALIPLTSQQPMAVRVKALECLAALATLPVLTILPYRDDVVRGMRTAVDDRKRVVRQAATHTRCLWTLVGAPGGS